jgi:hypothetical protein
VATIWERIDSPVLRWVFETWPSSFEHSRYDFTTQPPEPIPELNGMPSDDLDASLQRLRQYGLIDGDDLRAMGGSTTWVNLRVTHLGLIVLGEWPALELIETAAGIRAILREIAREAPDDEKSGIEHAAAFVGQTADGVVKSTLAEVTSDLVRDVIE